MPPSDDAGRVTPTLHEPMAYDGHLEPVEIKKTSEPRDGLSRIVLWALTKITRTTRTTPATTLFLYELDRGGGGRGRVPP